MKGSPSVAAKLLHLDYGVTGSSPGNSLLQKCRTSYDCGMNFPPSKKEKLELI
jgi:hypothetical protein